MKREPIAMDRIEFERPMTRIEVKTLIDLILLAARSHIEYRRLYFFFSKSSFLKVDFSAGIEDEAIFVTFETDYGKAVYSRGFNSEKLKELMFANLSNEMAD